MPEPTLRSIAQEEAKVFTGLYARVCSPEENALAAPKLTNEEAQLLKKWRARAGQFKKQMWISKDEFILPPQIGVFRRKRCESCYSEETLISTVLSDKESCEERTKALTELPKVLFAYERAGKDERDLWKKFIERHREEGGVKWAKFNLDLMQSVTDLFNRNEVCSMYSLPKGDEDSTARKCFLHGLPPGMSSVLDHETDFDKGTDVDEELSKMWEAWTKETSDEL